MHHHILPLAIVVGVLGGLPMQAQAQSSQPQAKQAASEGSQYGEPMRRLLNAAQRLRDATHAIAGSSAPAPKTIEQINEALLETQRAMVQLPPELRQAPDSALDHQKAMDRLKQAAQKLRDATHAMAEQSAGKGRNDAIRQTNEALLETQQAMVNLLAAPAGSASGQASKSGGTTSGGSTSGESKSR